MMSLLLAVAIVAHDPGYYTSLSKHIQRWLTNEGVPAKVETPATMAGALAKERLAFLVGFASPSAAEMKTLKAFRARGGKLVVFHSASPALAELMGVKPLGYKAAAYPGQWSRMNFAAMPEGFPKSILQTSSVLQRAVPLKGKGRVIATWADRSGRSTGDAAWIATSGGFWMTHVLLADGDEELKAQLLGAIAGSVEPQVWSAKRHFARKEQSRLRLKNLALKQVPRAGEIHAVWDHTGCGLYPGNWPKTMKILEASRVTDLFVNVAGAGFAHYPSAVLARSKICQLEGDQLSQCLAAARNCGIRVHAWILCFTATRAAAGEMERFKRLGWRLNTVDGKLSEYLNPADARVGAHLLSAIDEIQSRYALAGIHLDFVRWYERSRKSANATDAVTRFVSSARRRVKRPKWLTVAVLGKYPQCVASVGQDWVSWLDMGIVDYVVPMDYTESKSTFEGYLRQHASTRRHARRTIAGIGVTANESRLDAAGVIEQINLARKYDLAGVALFDLDTLLEKSILPYLRLGIW
jgi:uncharacterized lipoprotein YddW (UPF0748 family)